jgi:hypothetical protein
MPPNQRLHARWNAVGSEYPRRQVTSEIESVVFFSIAIEVASNHSTWLSGKESGHIPYPIDGFFGRQIGIRLIRFIGHRILAMNTPIGRKARPNFLHRTPPLIRVKPEDLTAAGVQRVGKVVGVKDGLPLLFTVQVACGNAPKF